MWTENQLEHTLDFCISNSSCSLLQSSSCSSLRSLNWDWNSFLIEFVFWDKYHTSANTATYMQNNELRQKTTLKKSLPLSIHFHTEVEHVLARRCDWQQDSFPSCCALAEYDIPVAKCFSYRLNGVCFQHCSQTCVFEAQEMLEFYLNTLLSKQKVLCLLGSILSLTAHPDTWWQNRIH